MSNDAQGALKERGIDKMLDEARDDHKENDVLHMKRGCENSPSLLMNFFY